MFHKQSNYNKISNSNFFYPPQMAAYLLISDKELPTGAVPHCSFLVFTDMVGCNAPLPFFHHQCTDRKKFNINFLTFISLINVKSHLMIWKKNPPSTHTSTLHVYWFFSFFHPPHLFYCSYVLVFPKKSHLIYYYGSRYLRKSYSGRRVSISLVRMDKKNIKFKFSLSRYQCKYEKEPL